MISELWETPGGLVVKHLALSLLWHGFSPWLRNSSKPQAWPIKEKTKQTKTNIKNLSDSARTTFQFWLGLYTNQIRAKFLPAQEHLHIVQLILLCVEVIFPCRWALLVSRRLMEENENEWEHIHYDGGHSWWHIHTSLIFSHWKQHIDVYMPGGKSVCLLHEHSFLHKNSVKVLKHFLFFKSHFPICTINTIDFLHKPFLAIDRKIKKPTTVWIISSFKYMKLGLMHVDCMHVKLWWEIICNIRRLLVLYWASELFPGIMIHAVFFPHCCCANTFWSSSQIHCRHNLCYRVLKGAFTSLQEFYLEFHREFHKEYLSLNWKKIWTHFLKMTPPTFPYIYLLCNGVCIKKADIK